MSTLSQFVSSSARFRNNRQLYLRAGTYTFTVPNNISQVLGVAIGAGGGGVRVSNIASYYAFGGAGGGYAQGVIPVTPGQALTVTLGAGGAGATAINTSGSAGATSSIGAFLSATGGAGGNASSATPPTAGSGSTSGVSEAFTSSGGSSGLVYLSYRHASGGGASGTPFGTGQTSSNCYSSQGDQASAGGSWCCLPTRTFRDITGIVEGGHGTSSYGSFNYTTSQSCGANGGTGGVCAGGRGGIFLSSTLSNFLMAENGSGNEWWFPWEIAGGGGGSGPPNDPRIPGANGGPGASGGSALYTSSGGAKAGNGGFGAGGSAAVSTGSQTFAGSGGNGGGGGGVSAASANNPDIAAGSGGPGAVIIYW